MQPILRLLNLQLQRQRCSRIERFYISEKSFLFSKRAMLLVSLLLKVVGLAHELLIFRMLFFLAEKKLLEESCFKTAGEK
jgi:hypothetical protein